jgi:hypothetical protein
MNRTWNKPQKTFGIAGVAPARREQRERGQREARCEKEFKRWRCRAAECILKIKDAGWTVAGGMRARLSLGLAFSHRAFGVVSRANKKAPPPSPPTGRSVGADAPPCVVCMSHEPRALFNLREF